MDYHIGFITKKKITRKTLINYLQREGFMNISRFNKERLLKIYNLYGLGLEYLLDLMYKFGDYYFYEEEKKDLDKICLSIIASELEIPNKLIGEYYGW
jgi:hypothetical protein